MSNSKGANDDVKVEVELGYILASFSLHYAFSLPTACFDVLFCTMISMYLGTSAHRAQLSITCRLGVRAQAQSRVA